MKKTLDRIITSTPVDRTAADVTERQGEHWSPQLEDNERCFELPPPTRPVPADAPRLIGIRVGRLTVIGLHADSGQSNGASWVCRCTCGRYQLRKAKSLTQPNSNSRTEPMCAACDRLEHVRWAYTNLPPRNFKVPTIVRPAPQDLDICMCRHYRDEHVDGRCRECACTIFVFCRRRRR